jgi:hypothetical protein
MYSSIFEPSQEHIYTVVVSSTIRGVEDSIYRRPATEDIIAEDKLAKLGPAVVGLTFHQWLAVCSTLASLFRYRSVSVLSADWPLI